MSIPSSHNISSERNIPALPAALILAAGRGSRLGSLTDTTPKGLVSYNGTPIILRSLNALEEAGITDVGIVTGYCSDRFAMLKRPCIHNSDYATTNMVTSFFCAKQRFDRTTIVSYGDIIYHPSIVTNLINASGDIVVTIDVGWYAFWQQRMDNVLADAETLVLDASGAIASLGERAHTIEEIAGQYIGLIKFSSEALQAISRLWDGLNPAFVFRGRLKHQLYFTDLLQLAIHDGLRVDALPIDGGWMEFDTPSDLQLSDRTGRVAFPDTTQ